jgi:hypothetical protein
MENWPNIYWTSFWNSLPNSLNVPRSWWISWISRLPKSLPSG